MDLSDILNDETTSTTAVVEPSPEITPQSTSEITKDQTVVNKKSNSVFPKKKTVRSRSGKLCVRYRVPEEWSFIHFNKTEAECLIRLFNTLLGEQTDVKEAQRLNQAKFRYILLKKFGLTHDLILDRVFHVFDKDNDGYVSVKEWIDGLEVFLRGTLNEKIKFCFDVYDLNGQGYITQKEMFQWLKDCVVTQLNEEDTIKDIKCLVEITLRMMDCDHDGRISYADFEKAVRNENLLLEAFRTCLPDATHIHAFELQAFQDTPSP